MSFVRDVLIANAKEQGVYVQGKEQVYINLEEAVNAIESVYAEALKIARVQGSTEVYRTLIKDRPT